MTTTTVLETRDSTVTPTDRMLNTALVVAPVIYLAADATYAARGWDDATAGVLHVLGAIAYGFLALRVALWLPAGSVLKAGVITTGLIGMAGNVGYGFDAIHMSLGDAQLVDQPGAANLIKLLGLFFPISLAVVALALAKLGHRWQGVAVLVAAIGWPVAHIANMATLAVAVNVVLVIALGSLAWANHDRQDAPAIPSR